MEKENLQREIRKKHRVRHGISLLLSFLLAILMLLFSGLLGVYLGVFNEDIILMQLNKSGYYEKVRDTIEDNLDAILLPLGLPKEDILKDIITLKRVYIGAKQNIEATLHGNPSTLNEEEIKARIGKNMQDYVEANYIQVTEEVTQGMNQLTDSLTSEYIRLLKFPFSQYFVRYKELYTRILFILCPLLLILMGVIMVVLLKLHHYKHRGLRYVSYSCMSTAGMLLLLPGYLLISGIYKNISVTPVYFYRFIVDYMRWDIAVFIYLGVFWVGSFCCMLVMIRSLKRVSISGGRQRESISCNS